MGLAVELRATRLRCPAKELSLSAIYTNTGSRPLALAFWWNRSMRIVDATGAIVQPDPGPVLPCGRAERWQIVMPRGSMQRAEPLSCSQPAGRSPNIGWSYVLPRGTYRITLVFEAPPTHGFSQSESNEYAFRGRVESQELAIEIV